MILSLAWVMLRDVTCQLRLVLRGETLELYIVTWST